MEVLAGLGVFGIVATWVLAGLLVLVIPVLAIADCAATRKHEGSRAIIIVLIVLSWSLGGVIYAIAFAGWRWLRAFTALCLIGLVLLAIVSTVSCVIGAHGASEAARQATERQRHEAIEAFQPTEIPSDSVAPFPALLRIGGSRSVAQWTLDGPLPGSARPADPNVRQIAVEPGSERVFALTRHELGTISPATGSFIQIEIDPALDQLSWPSGVAFVPGSREVVVMSSHVLTRFHVYAPDTGEWRRVPAEHRDLDATALTWHPTDEALYAIANEPGGASLATIDTLYRFNMQGALTGTVSLNPAVPVLDRHRETAQLVASGRYLVLVLGTGQTADGSTVGGVLAIDPANGEVAKAADSSSEEPATPL
jgi:hypothetical protein